MSDQTMQTITTNVGNELLDLIINNLKQNPIAIDDMIETLGKEIKWQEPESVDDS